MNPLRIAVLAAAIGSTGAGCVNVAVLAEIPADADARDAEVTRDADDEHEPMHDDDVPEFPDDDRRDDATDDR